MPFDARFYSGMNTGAALVASKDAIFTDSSNTGAALTPSKDSWTYDTENTGFVLPARISLTLPQFGWGAPMTPEQVVTLIPAAADAYTYTTEGDVT